MHVHVCRRQNRERGIQGEKSSRDIASSRNLVSAIGAQASPKRDTEPGVRKGKRSLLASHTRCKYSMETTHNSVNVKLGRKVMELVESQAEIIWFINLNIDYKVQPRHWEPSGHNLCSPEQGEIGYVISIQKCVETENEQDLNKNDVTWTLANLINDCILPPIMT